MHSCSKQIPEQKPQRVEQNLAWLQYLHLTWPVWKVLAPSPRAVPMTSFYARRSQQAPVHQKVNRPTSNCTLNSSLVNIWDFDPYKKLYLEICMRYGLLWNAWQRWLHSSSPVTSRTVFWHRWRWVMEKFLVRPSPLHTRCRPLVICDCKLDNAHREFWTNAIYQWKRKLQAMNHLCFITKHFIMAIVADQQNIVEISMVICHPFPMPSLMTT